MQQLIKSPRMTNTQKLSSAELNLRRAKIPNVKLWGKLSELLKNPELINALLNLEMCDNCKGKVNFARNALGIEVEALLCNQQQPR